MSLCFKSVFIICVSLSVLSWASPLPACPTIPSLSCCPSSVPPCFCLSFVYVSPFVCFCDLLVPMIFYSFPSNQFLSAFPDFFHYLIYLGPFSHFIYPRNGDADVLYLDPPEPSGQPTPTKTFGGHLHSNFTLASIANSRIFACHSCLNPTGHWQTFHNEVKLFLSCMRLSCWTFLGSRYGLV